MSVLTRLFKKAEAEKKPEPRPPDFNRQVDDLLSSARGDGAVDLWEVSYTTSIDSAYGVSLEGTYLQVLKWALERPGKMGHLAILRKNPPTLLR